MKNVGKISFFLAWIATVIVSVFLFWKFWKVWKRHPLRNSLILISVILITTFSFMYTFRTMELTQSKTKVDVVDAWYYMRNGMINDVPAFQYKIAPSSKVEPDKIYNVTFTNGLVTYTDKVSWSSLELGIDKPILIRRDVSPDEYQAIINLPAYSFTITEIVKEHDARFIIIPVLYLIIGATVLIWLKDRRQLKRVRGRATYRVYS